MAMFIIIYLILSVYILCRYYSIYSKGFPGAVALRTRLMQTESIADVAKVLG